MKIMTNSKLLLVFSLCGWLLSCQNGSKDSELSVTVENSLGFGREEVVSIASEKLSLLLENNDGKNLRVLSLKTDSLVPIQWLDYDGDGKMDELLFLAKVGANSSTDYQVILDSINPIPKSSVVAYSRYVPERVDDYTWENDKVAFRMYGPKGQEGALAGIKGSTLSSGVDIWLKNTERSIIDEWYKGYETDPMFYHIDKGEGYDPYHVGDSRGTGGLGIWANDSLFTSKNYISYKTISQGPLRTVFELTYAPWSDYGVTETKRISLDIGSNFSKFESYFKTSKPVPNYTIGISLHKNEGVSKIDAKEGWSSHWEAIDDVFVGEGLVVDPAIIDTAFARASEVPDQSNILMVLHPNDTVKYYAGFAWQKSGQITDENSWLELLKKQTQLVANPLKITFK